VVNMPSQQQTKQRFLSGPCGGYVTSLFVAKLDQTGDPIGELSRRRSEVSS
jgi:hypothetical protein